MAEKSTETTAAADSVAGEGRLATDPDFGTEVEAGVVGAHRSGAAAVELAAWVGGLLSASATTLAVPEVCLKSEVNSDRYAICRCCRADQGGVTRDIAATNGL
jgi:hypothetical protein